MGKLGTNKRIQRRHRQICNHRIVSYFALSCLHYRLILITICYRRKITYGSIVYIRIYVILSVLESTNAVSDNT